MKLLSFILTYPLLWLISILPFRVLYVLSDGFYILLFHIVGYRKKVVIDNLKLAFTNKSQQEIHSIAKKFYRHFIDIFFVEMVKSFTMSAKEMTKRYKPLNIEVLHELQAKNKSAILLGAHYANWEWIFNFNLLVEYNGYAIYKKIKNPYFDKKIRETRGRFNTNLVPTKEIFQVIEQNQKEQSLSLYGFLGDQSPKVNKAHHWQNFMGVHVPVYTGVEFIAKKYGLPIVYFKTKKVKRGFYETTLEVLTESPGDFKNYDLTDMYMNKVEQQIREAPEYYLWTHKRFKHKDKKPD